MTEFKHIYISQNDLDFLKSLKKRKITLQVNEVRAFKTLKAEGLISLRRTGNQYTFSITERGKDYLHFLRKTSVDFNEKITAVYYFTGLFIGVICFMLLETLLC